MEDKVISALCSHKEQQVTWEKSPAQIFWGEIATCDHSVQLYENDKVFLNTLESFAGACLISGDSLMIIATAEHLAVLEMRLVNQGFNMPFLKSSCRYVGLDADVTLGRFIVNNQVNEKLFMDCIGESIHQVEKNNGKVRAFGEMVALLWQRGMKDATIALERLWNQLHHRKNFTLFCAYPKNIFSTELDTTVHSIYDEHDNVIDGAPRPSTEVYYRKIA